MKRNERFEKRLASVPEETKREIDAIFERLDREWEEKHKEPSDKQPLTINH